MMMIDDDDDDGLERSQRLISQPKYGIESD
jgi:hypothetical protein